jgi:hypothetical protein
MSEFYCLQYDALVLFSSSAISCFKYFYSKYLVANLYVITFIVVRYALLKDNNIFLWYFVDLSQEYIQLRKKYIVPKSHNDRCHKVLMKNSRQYDWSGFMFSFLHVNYPSNIPFQSPTWVSFSWPDPTYLFLGPTRPDPSRTLYHSIF